LSTPYEPPRNDLEKKIAAVWQELLGIDQIGIYDSFFDLGGDSLNMVQLGGKLKNVLNREVPVAMLFRNSTIHSFIQSIEGEADGSGNAAEEAERLTELAKSKNRLKERVRRREEIDE
jgi:fengycin family lipopeptide synthetase D